MRNTTTMFLALATAGVIGAGAAIAVQQSQAFASPQAAVTAPANAAQGAPAPVPAPMISLPDFSVIAQPSSSDSSSERRQGVRTTWPSRMRAAAAMSSKLTAIALSGTAIARSGEERRLAKAGMLRPAEKVLRSILKADEECLIAMNELGKVLHVTGRHEEALDTLRSASRLSPQNLQRLCLIGEVELNLQDPESAQAFFEQALAIDEADAKAQAGRVVAANMIELNNTYAVDGRDPNSYNGILWTLGLFDRPWGPERAIFGTVRYMSSTATVKKLRMKRYLAQFGSREVSRK